MVPAEPGRRGAAKREVEAMGFLSKVAAGAAKAIAVAKATDLARDAGDGLTGAVDRQFRPEHRFGIDHPRTIGFAADHPGWEYTGFLQHAARCWTLAYEAYLRPGAAMDALAEVATDRVLAQVDEAASKRDGAYARAGSGNLELREHAIEHFDDHCELQHGTGRKAIRSSGPSVTVRTLGAVPLRCACAG